MKIIITAVFSMLFVFLPVFLNFQNWYCINLTTNTKIEQHLCFSIPHSVCSAATNYNKATTKYKNVKREPSFISKAAGFVIGIPICKFLMAISAGISYAFFKNNFNLNTNEGPWVKHGILTGLFYFIGRCIVTGLIFNLFTVTANVMGFITWFDYAIYAVIALAFLNEGFKGSFCLAVVGGYILGIGLMEKFFG